jgi:hypothetical protein
MMTLLKRTLLFGSMFFFMMNINAETFVGQQDFSLKLNKLIDMEEARFDKEKRTGKWVLIPQYHDSFYLRKP